MDIYFCRSLWFSYFLSNKLTEGKFHGSAIAILLGLLFAYLGGTYTGGKQGVADISLLSGVGLLAGVETHTKIWPTARAAV